MHANGNGQSTANGTISPPICVHSRFLLFQGPVKPISAHRFGLGGTCLRRTTPRVTSSRHARFEKSVACVLGKVFEIGFQPTPAPLPGGDLKEVFGERLPSRRRPESGTCYEAPLLGGARGGFKAPIRVQNLEVFTLQVPALFGGPTSSEAERTLRGTLFRTR